MFFRVIYFFFREFFLWSWVVENNLLGENRCFPLMFGQGISDRLRVAVKNRPRVIFYRNALFWNLGCCRSIDIICFGNVCSARNAYYVYCVWWMNGNLYLRSWFVCFFFSRRCSYVYTLLSFRDRVKLASAASKCIGNKKCDVSRVPTVTHEFSKRENMMIHYITCTYISERAFYRGN